MSPDQLFQIATYAAMAGWVVLLLNPLLPRLSDMVAGIAVPALLSLAYVCLILFFWGSGEGGFDSLANVALLFETEQILLAGWIHYLAFDLFVGGWIVRTARQAGIPFWMILPCLPATFLFGPAGLLLFLILRLVRREPLLAADAEGARP